MELNNMIKNNIPIDTQYAYEILTPKYTDDVVKVFTQAFCRSEPMTHYLNMDEKKYAHFARAVTEQACKDELSIIALDNHKVIACALVEDLAEPGNLPDFDPKFIYILSLLEKLGENFFSDKIFSKKQIAHLFITAVDENYRHQGLSKQVNFRAMDLAAQHQFNFVYCELTHYYNELGIIPHLKNPKRLIGSCIYQNFTYDTLHPFEYLEGKATSYLWTINDQTQLTYQQNNKTIVENI